MLNMQALLTSLHNWAQHHYFVPEWQRLELDTATELIYRKARPGQMRPRGNRSHGTPYCYPEHPQAMEGSCRHFHEAQVC